MQRRMQAFCSRYPLFVAACVVVCGIIAADRDWRIALGLILVACPLIGGWKRGVGWALCGGIAVANFSWRVDQLEHSQKLLLEQRHSVTVEARVLEDARGGDGFWSAPAKLRNGPADGAKIWWQGMGPAPHAGTWIRASGEFNPPTHPRNPGEFDQVEWMRRQGLAAVFKAGRGQTETKTNSWSEWTAGIREAFRRSVTDGLQEDSLQAQVIRAVVLGEHPADADELVMHYRHSGTLHVFCVSGLHVGMVGLLGWTILRWLGVSRRWAVLALLPLMFGYAWLTGNGPPAVRASWMAMVFLMAFVLRRRPDLLNALGAVLLLTLLWDSRMLFYPGVQLSYGVVCAIAIGVGVTRKWFSWMSREAMYVPTDFLTTRQKMWLGFRKKTAQSLAVSTAAWTGSTPLTAYHFGLITPASIPATVLQIPVIFLLLGAALLSAVIHPLVPPVSRGINRITAVLADGSVMIAKGFASVPGGNFQLQADREPHLLIYDLDFGSAAACFTDGSGGGVLLDCGDRFSFKKRVAPSLHRLGILPDAVVLTHPDGNHLGGGSAVWESLPIRQVLLPVSHSRSPSYRDWLENAPAAGIKTHMANAGRDFPFPDNAWLEILHVAPESFKDAAADERVMISRLHWRGWKILFTSDAGMGLEGSLIREGVEMSADLIIAGRHSRDLSLHDDFIDHVKPLAILPSNSFFPPEQRLDPAQVAYWRSIGIQVIDPSETGAVTVKITESGEMEIRGFVNGSCVTLVPR